MPTKTATPAKKATPAKPAALSLHIGLNAVSPTHYGGWSGDLAACEADADDMQAIAKSKGMKPTVLMTAQATRAAVLAALRKAAKTLKKGDFFFLTFSGHGGQVADVTGEEIDRKDETWCLWDSQLIDDELYLELSRFAAGVRILVLSDSCHSGTVTRDAVPTPTQPGGARSRMMPPAIALRTYRNHKAFYDGLQQDVAASAVKSGFIDPDAALAQVAVTSTRLTTVVNSFAPSVILISGCQDNQTAMDGDFNGAFTGRLLQVWNNGRFSGNYTQFRHLIAAGLPPTQSPNLFVLGSAASFLTQRPFTV
ncbi:caspase family protein [Sphaerotilus sp.]|uniref:caspase family protein n=1 Tax=Sphaerotilus sp. TaxID=2093942 RepID=UPI002ACE8369|nr:caspase family protein [Sphaerotilus sp.]MDZ7857982.1 caspase family protein [Sphaerotilus sp.]